MTWTCRDCKETITGGKSEHCPVCHETFTGTEAGDLHRAGRHGVDRHCLTPAQMEAKGLTRTSKGHWQREREGRTHYRSLA